MATPVKLYPPIIGDSIPAFYLENGAAKIAVPFSLNRAVSENQIGGFVIKIKTVQSNVLKKTIQTTDTSTVASSLGSHIVNFVWEDFDPAVAGMSVGQFFKIQIAFIDKSKTTIGFFSNVGIIKFTAKPKVYILDAEPKTPNAIEMFKMSYVGVYEPSPDDTSERPYSYCFNLYNSDRLLVETSDWKLHNTSVNHVVSESMSLNATMDTYSFKTALIPNEQYYIQYFVRTINNLELETVLYSCVDLPIEATTLPIRLICENNFENGYINMRFGSNQHKYQKLTLAKAINSEIIKSTINKYYQKPLASPYYLFEGEVNELITVFDDAFSKTYIYTNFNPFNWFRVTDTDVQATAEKLYKFLKSFNFNENAVHITSQITKQNIINYNNSKQQVIKWLEEYVEYTEAEASNLVLANPVSFIIERADHSHNYANWTTLKRVYFATYERLLSWSFKDFTIEQGELYKYAIRQFNKDNIMTERTFGNDNIPLMGDFEDMYLLDTSGRQVRIRFNPKITSFKNTVLEQKVETLGSKYPFVFKNGIVNYKEFPISGLISYLADENELFVNYKKDLNIDAGEKLIRDGTPSTKSIFNSDLQVATTSVAESYNIYAERQFKLLLLEWLNNGEIKLFRSSTEGNYLVRLINIQMSPEDKTGRMLHTFTAQACEIAEYSIENLINFGFLEINDYKLDTAYTKSVHVYEQISGIIGDGNPSINTSFLINQGDKIINHLVISPTENTEDGFGLILRIGANDPSKKTYILPGHELNLSLDNAVLPDVYFNALDNLEIINNMLTKRDNTNTARFASNVKYNTTVTINTAPSESVSFKSMVRSLLNDLIVTYACYTSEYLVGTLGHIDTVYLENVIETRIGPDTLDAPSAEPIPLEGSGTSSQLLRYIMLNFYEKPIIDLTKIGSNYFTEINGVITQLNAASWSELCLYRVSQSGSNYMNLTTDTELNNAKNYYTRLESGSLYYYKLVTNPKKAQLSTYYEAKNQQYFNGKTKGTITGPDYTIELTLDNGITTTITNPPLIVNSGYLYTHIAIGNAVYLQTAYQQRVVKYKVGG